MLIRSAVFEKVPGFDERLNLTGGEDALFSARVNKAGCRIVSSLDAVVFETVILGRMSVSSISKRGYQYGSSSVIVYSLLGEKIYTRLFRLVKACVKAFLYGAYLVPSLVKGRICAVWTLRKISQETGIILSMLGRRYHPYRNGSK